MPMALRERIAADIKAVMDSDAIIENRLILTAQIPNPGGPAEFAKSIDEQRGSPVSAKESRHAGEAVFQARCGGSEVHITRSESKCGLLNQKPHQINRFASVPLIPKFANEGAAQ